MLALKIMGNQISNITKKNKKTKQKQLTLKCANPYANTNTSK